MNFKYTSIIDSKPSIEQLCSLKVIEEVASDWEQLAVKLDTPQHLIRNLQRDHPHQCVEACTAMFKQWLKKEARTPASWRGLTKALCEIEYNVLAKNLTKLLGT